MSSYDVIVAGCGGVGSAALMHLAERGISVLGIDRFSPPHDQGSSHGDTRVIRQAYFEHADYVPLIKRSYDLWHDLEQATQRKLYTQTGLIEVGPMDGVVVPGVLNASKQHSLDVELLTPNEVAHEWPGIVIPDGLTAVFEREAGYLAVEDCVSCHLEQAKQYGATLLENTIVQGWAATTNGVTIESNKGQFSANSLVVTVGSWATQLLRNLDIDLLIRRKSLFCFHTSSSHYEAAARNARLSL